MLQHNEHVKKTLKKPLRQRIYQFLIKFSKANWNQPRKFKSPKDQLTPNESKALWSRIQNTLHSL